MSYSNSILFCFYLVSLWSDCWMKSFVLCYTCRTVQLLYSKCLSVPAEWPTEAIKVNSVWYLESLKPVLATNNLLKGWMLIHLDKHDFFPPIYLHIYGNLQYGTPFPLDLIPLAEGDSPVFVSTDKYGHILIQYYKINNSPRDK